MRLCSRFRVALLASVLTTALGCDQAPPDQIRLVLPPEPITTTDPAKLDVQLRSAGQEQPAKLDQVDFSLKPEAVVELDAAGFLKCLKAGDVTIEANVRGVSKAEKLRCRPVAKLEVKLPERWDITQGPLDLSYQAFDTAGTELSDVPIVLRSKNPGVIKPDGGQFVPVSVGAATLMVRAGAQEQKIKVDIVRKIKPEALPMNDGQRIHFSLEPGKYRLDVELAKEAPMKMEWRGAPYCDYQGAAKKTHTSTCVMRAKGGGGVIFDNPAFLNDGSTEVSHAGISIAEVPE